MHGTMTVRVERQPCQLPAGSWPGTERGRGVSLLNMNHFTEYQGETRSLRNHDGGSYNQGGSVTMCEHRQKQKHYANCKCSQTNLLPTNTIGCCFFTNYSFSLTVPSTYSIRVSKIQGHVPIASREHPVQTDSTSLALPPNHLTQAHNL